MKLKLNLSSDSIKKAIESVKEFESCLEDKCDEACKQLAMYGAEQAKLALHSSVNGEYATGELEDSITYEKLGKCKYLVFTDNPCAPYVEFGTGVVGSGTYKGELPSSWAYDTRKTPALHDPDDPERWFYFNEVFGEWVPTKGQEAHAFMAQAAEAMKRDMPTVIKEVFK